MSTICAIATSKGGAIGIIRVSGPDSIAITDRIFRGRRKLVDAPGYSLHYGTIVTSPSPLGERVSRSDGSGAPIDDVLVSLFRAPHSYTGEDSVEISAHGSPYILQTICSLLIAEGCLPAQPGEFTQRAFLNGKLDLTQAEAVADLIASQNASQHRVAMQQMRGGISQKLTNLREQLLQLTSLLELELDFSEEDVEFASRQQLLSIARDVQQEITRLSSSFSTGNAIKNGIPVAIIGAPNVGKSTLLNALLHDDRAIVSDIQGTTRDTIEDTVTISGISFRFIDTAGIRHTSDTIEQLGIERSLKAAERAQIIILMRDDDSDYPSFDAREDQTVIRVHNKSEQFQALTGKGMEWLEQELLNSTPAISDDDVLITNIRHKQALDISLTDIERTILALEQNLPGDLIAEDLRQCLHHLAEITGGAIDEEEVLGNIFKHFCIGK